MLSSRITRRRDARKRRAIKVSPPSSLERSYTKQLIGRVKLTQSRLMRRIEKLLKAREREEQRGDTRSDGEQLDLFIDLIGESEKEAKTKQVPSPAALSKTAGSVDAFTTRQMRVTFAAAPKPVGLSLAAPATATRGKWVKANVQLITSIDKRYFADIRGIMRKGLESGRSTRSIRRELERRFAVSKARAELIARDQISKLNGDITRVKQKKAGIKSYTWSTSGDERVRQTHADNDGKTFLWSEPPATGHPGQDFQCRCVALPNLEDLK